jgi:glycine betaine/proline transport system substrate-binding protein
MMNAVRSCRAMIARAALAIVSSLVCAAGFAQPSPGTEIDIGWTAWSDAEFVTKLVGRLLEDRLGHEVTLTLVDVALQYQGVARGDLDLMLMAWLPETHADYYAEFGDEVVDLGPIYTGARLGWVVPAYVPESEVASIADLAKPEIGGKLDYQIFGIDPGAGLMRLSEETVEAYGLDRYNLIASSGAAMTAMLERADLRKRWIVATGWRPHWMFQKWDLRFLADPKGTLGGLERIDALARRGLYKDAPDVVAFVSRLFIPLDQLEAAMSRAEETSYEQAVDEYIAEHPHRVAYWTTGEIAEKAPQRAAD